MTTTADRAPTETPGAALPQDQARLAAAHALIEREVVPRGAPGCVLAVARADGPASVRGFGLARWDPEEQAAGPDTVYALASITKPFVAVAAVQLAERGRLGLEDPLVAHLPEFAGAGAPEERAARRRVTLRHLLAHTSGLDADWQDPRTTAGWERESSWDALVRLSCGAPMRFAPGTRFLYSGDNPTLLAEVVRRRTGLPIDAYLRAHVFAPLGMADTGFFPPPALRPRLAQVAGYRWPEDRTPRTTINKSFPPEVRVPRPGGGLFSSARDLVAFGRACLRVLRGERPAGAPLTRAGLAAMLEPQTAGLPSHDAGKAATAARGLGWELPGRFAADRGGGVWSPSAFGHKGSSGTGLRIDPERDLVVVFLASRTGTLGPARLKERVLQAAAAGRSG